MADSPEFGKIVRQIIKADGLKRANAKTGISTAYLNMMQNGHVPSDELIGKFASAYRLEPEISKDLFDAAKEIREDIEIENLIQVACDAEGMTASQRMRVLKFFEQVKSEKNERHDTAA